MRRKLVAIFFGFGLVIGHTLFAQAPAPQPKPIPQPAPQPTPAPAPAPVTHPPVANLTGMFWTNASVSARGSADDGPLGMFVIDASASISDRPLKWKSTGPALTLIKLSPASGPAGSVVQAYPTQPGTYSFTVIAIGTADGQIDADAAVWTRTIMPPAPPQPQPTPTPMPNPPGPTPTPNPPPLPGPNPTPQPNPTPTPKPPFPSTQLEPERWREFEPPRKTRKTRSTTPAKVVEFSHALYSVPVAYTPADLVRRLDQIQILLDRYFPED